MINAIFSYLVVVVPVNAGIISGSALSKPIELIVFLIVYIINAILLNHHGVNLFAGMIKNLRSVRFSNF